jgi:hypothetical protein
MYGNKKTQEEETKISHSRDVGQIDIPTLLDVRTYVRMGIAY